MPTGDLDVRTIADMLRPHAESVAWQLFPAAKRDGPFLCVGSLHGEEGKSLKIKIKGPNAGSWADYATSQSDPRGKGDLLKLLQLTIAGGDMGRAVQEAKRILNLDSMDPRAMERHRAAAARAQARAEDRDRADQDKARRDAEGLWKFAQPPTPSSPHIQYLAGRGIDFAVLGHLPGALRYRHDVWHAQIRAKLPAMVSKFTAPDGTHAATHITYLDFRDGKWGKLTRAAALRMGMDAQEELRTKIIRGPAFKAGAHIPLWKGAQSDGRPARGKLADIPAGTAVHISEGIEDGLSFALADPSARVIAGGTLGIIGEARLPQQAGDCVILAQNDDKPEPIAALEAAIAAQQARAAAEGVQRVVRCRFPDPAFKDWNDWLMNVEKVTA